MDVPYNNHQPWSPTMNMIMEPLAEINDGFEPQTRARSNTWPLPRPENYVDPPDIDVVDVSNKCPGDITSVGGMATSSVGGPAASLVSGNSGVCVGVGGTPTTSNGGLSMPTNVATLATLSAAKKNSSRRNAWGNLSYADLITQAITSAPDKRLTLSQIYEWMVTNVPYFKDKGDSNSSAGWKNSIRHNLSLHNRFMRVQNEGTGKSSWWMINPDAKPGKSVRRRAASMETSKFEKRRGRVKKKVEALRNGLTADATPSPSSSVSEGLDMFPDSPLHSTTGFQLSPDFRPRASSATSSCGRLSPIPAIVGVEPDWSSPSQFNNPSGAFDTDSMVTSNNGSYSPDQLAGNLEQGMKLQTDAYLQGYVNGQTPQQPPPPYSGTYDSTFTTSGQTHRDLPRLAASQQYGVLTQCPLHRLQPCNCIQTSVCKIENLSPPSGMSPTYSQSEPSPDPLANNSFLMNTTPPPNGPPGTSSNPGTDGTVTPSSQSNKHPRPPSSSPPLTPQPTTNSTGPLNPSSTAQQVQASTMMGQLMGALNNSTLLDDLNLNIEPLHGGFDCNVDELIKHELSMGGSLDFNFTSSAQHHVHTINHSTLLPHHNQSTLSNHHLLNHQQDLNHLSGTSATSSATGNIHSSVQATPSASPASAYSTTSSVVTAPSWVH